MTLKCVLVEYDDVETCVRIRIDSLGSLVVGHLPAYESYEQDSIVRTRREIKNPKDYSHIHHMKVYDAENPGEIMAYAKWEVYENGRPDLEKLRDLEEIPLKPDDQYLNLRQDAHKDFCAKNAEIGKEPHILLALLVTTERHRGKGAGKKAVVTGLRKFDAQKFPCSLCASEEWRRLYKLYDFEELKAKDFNVGEYGLEPCFGKVTFMWREAAPIS